jgi:hypothetical protein
MERPDALSVKYSPAVPAVDRAGRCASVDAVLGKHGCLLGILVI